MRELKRSMARHNMKTARIAHINKKGYYYSSEKEKPRSFFARNWHKWIFRKPGRKAA